MDRCLAKVQMKVILTNSDGWIPIPMPGMRSQLLLEVSMFSPDEPNTSVTASSPAEAIRRRIQNLSTITR